MLIWPQENFFFKSLCFWSRQLSGTNIGQSPRLLLPLLSSPPDTRGGSSCYSQDLLPRIKCQSLYLLPLSIRRLPLSCSVSDMNISFYSRISVLVNLTNNFRFIRYFINRFNNKVWFNGVTKLFWISGSSFSPWSKVILINLNWDRDLGRSLK